MNGHDLRGPEDQTAARDSERQTRYRCSNCGELFHTEFVKIHRDLIQPCGGRNE